MREFASSEYARTVAGVIGGAPPATDLAAESRLIEALVAAAREGVLASAHDVSDGGLATALAESGFASGTLTAQTALEGDAPAELALFAESGARAVVSVAPGKLARVLTLAAQYGVAARAIGKVAHGDFQLTYNGAVVIRGPSANFREIWSGAIEQAVLGERAPRS